MQVYLDFLKKIWTEGDDRCDRTGVGTRSIFGYDMRFDLSKGFPLLSTKKVHFKSVAYELLWFLRGDTNTQYLKEHGVSIWDEWADAEGNLGPVYGKQWRAWQTADGRVIDQMADVVERIRRDPTSRRLLVNAWNVGELDRMALPPCHLLFQFYVAQQKLSCKLIQRSADAFLGVPFNIASYALLTHLVADQCGLEVGEFIWSGGDCHIYHNHQEAIETQLARTPGALPTLVLKRRPSSLFEYTYEDFEVVDYHPQPAIRAPVAV